MQDTGFDRAPAGWYPDPLGLPQLRWWDTIGWTQEVTEARQPMVMRQTSEKKFVWADDEMPTRRERRERRRREHAEGARSTVSTRRPSATTLLQLEPPKRKTAAADQAADQPGEPEAKDDAGAGERREPGEMGTHSATDQASTHEPAPEPARDVRGPAHDAVTDSPDAPHLDPHHKPGTESDLEADLVPSAEPDQDFSRFFEWGLRTDREPEPAFVASRTQHGTEHEAPARAQTSMPTAEWPRPAATESPADPITGTITGTITGMTPPTPSEPPAAPTISSTGAVWVIALIPVVQLVISLFLVSAFTIGSYPLVVAAIWLGPYPIVMVLAIVDRWMLRNAGYHRPAHWTWSLLGTPVYLIARFTRTARESGRGSSPLTTWMALIGVQIATVIAIPGLALAALPSVFSSQAEQSVVSDAEILGAHLTAVQCLDPLPTQIGGTLSCIATWPGNSVSRVTVSLQRLNGWITWRVEDWGTRSPAS